MEKMELDPLRYPIGRFKAPKRITLGQRKEWITVLEQFPQRLQELVLPLTEAQLESPYRPGGWTVRQLVHHLDDSHHNLYIRIKWALTEDNPLIKAYDEKAWAELIDSRTAPIALSLDHLRAVHAKLVYLVRGLSEEDLGRKFTHPHGKEYSLEEQLGLYAWHSVHHYTHIENFLKREKGVPTRKA